MGTNTGTPGFDIDGKTYDFDVGDVNAPGLAPIATNKGDISVDNGTKDLSKPTKTTLAQYLSDLTMGKQGHSKGTSNDYPVDAPANPVAEIDVSDAKGNPTPLNDTTNTAHFVARADAAGTVRYSHDLQAGVFAPPTTQGAQPVMPLVSTDPGTSLGGFVKGKSSVPGVDGNSLLHSVGKNSLPAPVKAYTSAVLSSNRFTDASPAARNVVGVGNDATRSDYNAALHHPRYGEVTLDRLAQVGTSLSMRATQVLNSATAGNNPTGGLQEISTLLPSPSQLGVTQINAALLEAADVFKSLTQEEVPAGDFLSIGDMSWGVLNNVDEPFSGIDAIGMIALAAALTAGVVVLFEGLGFLLNAIQGDGTGPALNPSGRYVLGRYSVTPGANPNAFPPNFPPNIGQLLGIRATTFPLGDALKVGTAAFFGIDTSTIGSALLSGISSAASSPGFNTVVARNIIRSSITIEKAFAKAANSSNFIAGVNNILEIVGAIRASKLIAAVNVFAVLGDAELTNPATLNAATDGIPEEPLKKSYIDAYPNDGPQTTVQKNRLQGTLKLAWSSNRAPSMYLVPDSVLSMQIADNKLGGFKGAVASSDALARTTTVVQTASDQKANGSRISADAVATLEGQLDAEYVPFYFHDIRTNEIISFHAFLNSLTEDFAPAWESVDGFGRVDSVKIYKHTGRRIGLSFYVAATSESDFDDMWVKINKLVTLVYPQYSQGRTLSNGQDTTFVQPFSQMFSASPLIRMRLGDLIRSNYSRFALARLFGAADGTMQLPDGSGAGQPIVFGGSADRMQQFEQAKALLPTQVNANNRFTVDAQGWKMQPSSLGGLTSAVQSLAGVSAPKQANEFNVRGSDLQYFEFEVIAAPTLDGNTTVCMPHMLTAAEIVDRTNVDSGTATQIANALDLRYSNTSDIKHCVIGANGYAIPTPKLTPTRKTLDSLFRQVFFDASTLVSNIDTLSSFLDPEKNALVKSFKSVQGKGLAGVIETLNFDWHEKVTWEDKTDSKAPKMVKVTLSFLAIHDISPGIDWLGYNRAPLYNVGNAMKMGKDQK